MAILQATLCAQIEVRAKYEGDWLPVVAVSGDRAFVLKDGKRQAASLVDVQVQPGTAFGAGQVTIGKIVADLDPQKNASAKERSRPDRVLFRYSAEVTSAEDLPDCYAVLVSVSNGSVCVNVQPLGRLRAGQAKRVEVETRVRADKVSDLHVFSGTLELRSNLVTAPYDARALWAELSGDSAGLSATELCDAEEGVPLALSRDGKFLATTRERGDHFGVLVYDLASMEVVCEVPADKEYRAVESLTWAGPHVAFVVDRKLKLLEVEKRACVVLRDGVERILTSAEQKPHILALIVEGSRAWERLTVAYDTQKRRTAEWDDLEYGLTLFDPNGEPRLCYDFEGASKVYRVRIGTSSRWVPLDSTVKQDGMKFSVRGDEMLDRKVQIESLGADGDTVYVSSRLNSDTFQLAAYSLSQGRITRMIAGHPKYDLTGSDFNVCELLIHRATSEPVGIVYHGEKPKVLWFDSGFAAVQKLVEGQFPGQSVIPLTWADDGGTFIYYVGSDQNPGVYYAFRPRGGKLIKLFSCSERLDPARLAKTTPFDFVARDGAKIHGYLTLPPQAGTTAMPLIVDIHGGPMARDSWGFNATNQFFATRGYAVLQVNYRGSSGYGAAYQAAGLRARLDTVVLDDIADGVHAALAKANIDPKRIAVMGASFGGWATYMSLIKYPELFRAGIAISAVSHLRDQQKDLRRGFDRYAYAVWQDILGRKDFAETERFIDPLLRAGELHQPIFIMHGGLDWVVEPTQADLMLRALQKHNTNVRSKVFPNAAHSYWSQFDRVVRLNESETFLRKYLAPEPESETPVAVTQQPGK
ncbi:MAG TPA: prolyl oligopeptidase family serine peptidase [Opitutaceae bacterium]|nr:prolyl oligopeptidase family serine peptidase [Opitutaceae bacterium]